MLAALCGGALLFSGQAQAHSAFGGLEGFGIGLLHPLVTVHQALLLLVLGLLAGQRGDVDLARPMLLFAATSALALLLTVGFDTPPSLRRGILAGALLAALLLVAAIPVPRGAFTPLFGLAALLLGLDSGVQPGASAAATATTLAAIWLSLGLCMLNLAYYASALPVRPWTRIGMRVAGSWIAAICGLVLVFALRGVGTGST